MRSPFGQRVPEVVDVGVVGARRDHDLRGLAVDLAVRDDSADRADVPGDIDLHARTPCVTGWEYPRVLI